MDFSNLIVAILLETDYQNVQNACGGKFNRNEWLNNWIYMQFLILLNWDIALGKVKCENI